MSQPCWTSQLRSGNLLRPCVFSARQATRRSCHSRALLCNNSGRMSSPVDIPTPREGPAQNIGERVGRFLLTLGAAGLVACVIVQGFPAEAAKGEYSYGGQALFDPSAYVGRWYEVASLKKGFAGEGQQDCHCTQGIYTEAKSAELGKLALEVSTFCIHGSPEGRISGIQGAVTCANPILLKVLPEFETGLERTEMIVEKCLLRFPSIPFIPPEPYDIIRTDYKNYALVQGAPDQSFVQIYSRTPNPGPEFIKTHKEFLRSLGYPADEIRDTPQDCPEVPMESLMGMMQTMEPMMTNTLPPERSPFSSKTAPSLQAEAVVPAELKGGVKLNPTNPLEALSGLLKVAKDFATQGS